MKKIKTSIAILLSLTMLTIVAVTCVPVSAATYAGGNGTEQEPYEIATAEQLVALASEVNGGKNQSGVYFKLTADITLNDTSDWENWTGETAPANEWTPIGNNENQFAGVFDGNGKTVSGIFISSEKGYVGLFGGVSGAVKNLTVDKSYISIKGTNQSYLGAIAGTVTGTVESCESYATVAGGNMGAGGIAGNCINGIISKCANYGIVDGYQQVGGIVGALGGTVSQCVNEGTVDGSKQFVGGIVGIAGASKKPAVVINCLNVGAVTTPSTGGGIAGRYGNVANCAITNCINGGNIIVGQYGGHIFGSAKSGNVCTVVNCYYDKSASADTTITSYGSNPDNIAESTACEKSQICGLSALLTTGFDDSIWRATIYGYPRLINVANYNSEVSVTMIDGAAARISSETKLRFLNKIDKEAYDSLVSIYGQNNVIIGTLIAKKSDVEASGGGLNFEDISSEKTVCYIPTMWYDITATEYVYSGYVEPLHSDNYGTEYCARAYVKIVYGEGADEFVVFYSDEVQTRSIDYVVTEALADVADTVDEKYIYDTNSGKYSPYTQEEQTTLHELLAS